MRLRLITALCLLLVGIGVIIALMGRAPTVEPVENDAIPQLRVELTNFSWGVQAVVTIDPYGENGWTWDNYPLFKPSIIYYRFNTSSPDICSSFGEGIAMKGRPDVIYWNITTRFSCDTCFYGCYAIVTNGSYWVVARIMEGSGDLPVDTSLDFSLEFRNGGLVVYIESPGGDLPEIDKICLGAEALAQGDEELTVSQGSTGILYQNETTLWCEPLPIISGEDQLVGDLDASVLWFCRALGRDKTIYWKPVGWAHFGDPPPVFTQPEN